MLAGWGEISAPCLEKQNGGCVYRGGPGNGQCIWLIPSHHTPTSLCFVSNPLHLNRSFPTHSPSRRLSWSILPGYIWYRDLGLFALSIFNLSLLATFGLTDWDGNRPQASLPCQVETYNLPKLQRMWCLSIGPLDYFTKHDQSINFSKAEKVLNCYYLNYELTGPFIFYKSTDICCYVLPVHRWGYFAYNVSLVDLRWPFQGWLGHPRS